MCIRDSNRTLLVNPRVLVLLSILVWQVIGFLWYFLRSHPRSFNLWTHNLKLPTLTPLSFSLHNSIRLLHVMLIPCLMNCERKFLTHVNSLFSIVHNVGVNWYLLIHTNICQDLVSFHFTLRLTCPHYTVLIQENRFKYLNHP